MFLSEEPKREKPDGSTMHDGWKNPTKVIKYANMFNVTRSKERLKRIDYVLVHSRKTPDEIPDPDDRKKAQQHIRMRHKFEGAMVEEGIQIQADTIGENVYMKLHVPFDRLCTEAEKMKLEMPLHGVSVFFCISCTMTVVL